MVAVSFTNNQDANGISFGYLGTSASVAACRRRRKPASGKRQASGTRGSLRRGSRALPRRAGTRELASHAQQVEQRVGVHAREAHQHAWVILVVRLQIVGVRIRRKQLVALRE